MSMAEHDVLAGAAHDALRAPSVLNTQPWRWRVDGLSLELFAERDRQLMIADPDARMLLVSCGAALHHARVAVGAAGWSAHVERRAGLPAGVLARITLTEPGPVDPEMRALHNVIDRRRTDRRPYGDQPVPAETLAALSSAAAAEGVHVHQVRPSQMPMLAIAAAGASASETSDPEYLNELMRWTNRPEWSGDGVPSGTAVRRVPRRVPVREFAPEPQTGIDVEPGGDRGASYVVLYRTNEEPPDWLRAGEALSSVLLTATAHGLSTAPMSDVIEVEHSRRLICGILGQRGEPYIAVRCGVGVSIDPLADAPRRAPGETIDGLPLT